MAIFLCFISGLITVLAFEPFALAWLVFLSLAVLFYYFISAQTKKQAFYYGLAFGYGLFGAGVSWVYVSLSTYGGMPLWMGGIAVLLFAGVLSVFPALVGYFSVLLVPRQGLKRLLVLPPCWILFEWLKGWVFTGFPWLEIGYSQTSTWLFALAPIGGVYSISLVLAIFSSLLVCSAVSHQRGLPLLTLLVMLLLLSPLNSIEWSTDTGDTVSVGVVQANVPIELKWQDAQRDRFIAQLVTQSQQLHQRSPIDLFVWPETALPLYRQQTDANFWQSIVPAGTALLTGLMEKGENNKFYNSAVLSCDGQQQVYRKRHLVPFGEYLPLRFMFDWVLDYLQLPMSDFSSWQGPQPLDCNGNINLSLSICYEDAFGSEWRHYIADASMLINISEDAWFGDSLAPHQRLQMAQMRAREFSRPLVRSANTGPSVFIDENGQVLASTEQFVEQSLSFDVQPQSGDTWYHRLGNWVIYFSFGYVLLIGIRQRYLSQSIKL